MNEQFCKFPFPCSVPAPVPVFLEFQLPLSDRLNSCKSLICGARSGTPKYNFLSYYSPDSLHVPTQFVRCFCSVDKLSKLLDLYTTAFTSSYLTYLLFKLDCSWLISYIHIGVCSQVICTETCSCFCLMIISHPFVSQLYLWLKASYMLATFHTMP